MSLTDEQGNVNSAKLTELVGTQKKDKRAGVYIWTNRCTGQEVLLIWLAAVYVVTLVLEK
jgi:hypothetical protein